MEEYFKREGERNYLVIEEEEREENYKYGMLRSNQIKGLLPYKIYNVDNNTRIQYDISSKQSLQWICEKRQLKKENFHKLLRAVTEVVQELARYFLPIEQLFFSPEYIYTDVETFEICFCYHPDREVSSACKEFHKLMEYLINHLDYEDKELVEQGYTVYRYTLQDNYNITKCIEKAQKQETYDEREEEDVVETEQEQRQEKEYIENKSYLKVAEGGIISTLFHRFKGENSMEKGEMAREEYKRESVTEVEEELYGTTVLLKEVSDKPMHYLLALSEGGYEDIPITKFPFVIGKGRDWSDGVIHHTLVSRIHAQLEEEDGEVYITDLNSTNGTFINDVQLHANETVQMKTGDIINFSEVCYRFV